MVERAKREERPIYRNRLETTRNKLDNPEKGDKSAWFRKKGYSAILRVEPTPGGVLKNQIKKRLDREELGDMMNLLIMEKSGVKVRQMVTNQTSPWPDSNCGRSECILCKDEEMGSRGACWTENATYRITCIKCKQEGRDTHYVGETGFSCYSRGAQHSDGLRRKEEDNVLFTHNVNQNNVENKVPNNPSQFKMERLGKNKLVLKTKI